MQIFVELPEVWATEFLDSDPACGGYWISSLTQSWQHGYPDNCTLPWTHYVDLVRRLRKHTSKPVLVDVDMLYNDTGIGATVARELHDVGCYGIVVESKRFPKINSLSRREIALSMPEDYCRLINGVKTAVPELKVYARNEYLAVTESVDTTVDISLRTIEAGADGAVIHWGKNSDTTLLKEALTRLREKGITTGIIPTRFLDQVARGEFDTFADFSILGNICSSYIRNAFSRTNVAELIKVPSHFEPILDRVESYEPKNHRTLVVLGAKPKKSGKYMLQQPDIVERFTSRLGDFQSIVFVIDSDMQCDIAETQQVRIARINNSLGEVHSLSCAAPHVHTDLATVVYADLDPDMFDHMDQPGLVFWGDTFAGILNLDTRLLQSILGSADPTWSILVLGSENKIKSTALGI